MESLKIELDNHRTFSDISRPNKKSPFKTKILALSKIILGIFLLFILVNTNAFAQNHVEIKGTVTDGADDTPLIGTHVIVPGSDEVTGTTIGTVTDLEGTYRIRVPEELDKLVFSFIGYKSETIEINGRTTINLTLEPDVVSSNKP